MKHNIAEDTFLGDYLETDKFCHTFQNPYTCRDQYTVGQALKKACFGQAAIQAKQPEQNSGLHKCLVLIHFKFSVIN